MGAATSVSTELLYIDAGPDGTGPLGGTAPPPSLLEPPAPRRRLIHGTNAAPVPKDEAASTNRNAKGRKQPPIAHISAHTPVRKSAPTKMVSAG
jgi:hypothetical protein